LKPGSISLATSPRLPSSSLRRRDVHFRSRSRLRLRWLNNEALQARDTNIESRVRAVQLHFSACPNLRLARVKTLCPGGSCARPALFGAGSCRTTGLHAPAPRATRPPTWRFLHAPGRRRLALMGPLLGALMLFQGLVVPALDGRDWSSGAALELDHTHPGCGHGHDHSVCTQIAGNRALSSVQVAVRLAVALVTRSTHTETPRLRSAVPVHGRHPRGPPSA
jgi:hypothetical protein